MANFIDLLSGQLSANVEAIKKLFESNIVKYQVEIQKFLEKGELAEIENIVRKLDEENKKVITEINIRLFPNGTFKIDYVQEEKHYTPPPFNPIENALPKDYLKNMQEELDNAEPEILDANIMPIYTESKVTDFWQTEEEKKARKAKKIKKI
jgi:hypothetical protein